MVKRSFDWGGEFMFNQKAREGIRQDIISQMWDLWATFTFFGIVGRPKAEKIIRKFFDNINRTAGMQLVSRGICLYVCYEKHAVKPGVHVHAFIRGINPIHAGLIQELAEAEIGESKVTPYDSSKNAAAYVSNKYRTPRYVDTSRVVIIHPKKFNPMLFNQAEI